MPADYIPIDRIEQHPAFRPLASIACLHIDLRYATADNFVGRNVYAGFDCAWLHVEAASKLENAILRLTQSAPKVRLSVLDALRPQRVQQALWDSLDGTDLRMYLAPPALGSLHSFGMAVDVTLLREDGTALDMGTAFDAMTTLAHPEFEDAHLASGALTATHLANRRLLRDAMTAAGFVGISTEWWHFDATDNKARVRETYLRVL